VTPVPNAGGRWINLSPFEYDEFGSPRAYVRMGTTAIEDGLVNSMDNATQQLLQALAGGNAADLQIVSRDGFGHDVSRGRNAVDGHEPRHISDRLERTLSSRRQRLLCRPVPVCHRGVRQPNVDGSTLARNVAEATYARAIGALAPP